MLKWIILFIFLSIPIYYIYHPNNKKRRLLAEQNDNIRQKYRDDLNKKYGMRL